MMATGRLGRAMSAFVASIALAGCSLGSDVSDGGCARGASGPGDVVAFDATSGDELWSSPVGAPNGAATFDEVTVVSSHAHFVRGFEIATGEMVWCIDLDPDAGDREFSGELEARGGIVAAGSVVGALTDDAVIAIDPASGSELWRRSVTLPWVKLQGGELLWVFDGFAAGTPVMVLDPASGVDVDAPDDGMSSALSFSMGVPPTMLDDFELSTGSATEGTSRQVMSASVSDGESIVWEATVPGFVAALVTSENEPLVVVLDQTRGTGVFLDGPDTRLSAYALAGDDPLWQVPLAGTPQLISQIADGVIAVPVGRDMHVIDLATGSTVWTSELSSVGQGGSYSLPGTFQFVTAATDNRVVAVGRAEQPYRD